MRLFKILSLLIVILFFMAGCGSSEDDGSSDGNRNNPLPPPPAPPATLAPTNKITAFDGKGQERFGNSVAISGDYAVVGAYIDNGMASQAGAAYIYRRISGSTWDGGTKIVSPNSQVRGYFGSSVAVSGDYVIVGAYGEDGGGTDWGAAYIFHRTGPNTWDNGTKIMPPISQNYEQFGFSVAISGDYAIVGAFGYNGIGTRRGAAYIYSRTGLNTWDSGQMIAASDAEDNDNFGYSVAISGDYAIVGAPLEGTASNDRPGAAYIFNRSGPGNIWASEVKVLALNLQDGDQFGFAVAINGDYAIMGAWADDQGGSNAGAAFIFNRIGPGNTWDGGTKILAYDPDPTNPDNFGWSVAISGNTVIVGSILEDDGGNQIDSGSAYKFQRTGPGNVWDTGFKLFAPDPDPWDNFGYSVGISGAYVIVGAYGEDDRGSGAGAAYFH